MNGLLRYLRDLLGPTSPELLQRKLRAGRPISKQLEGCLRARCPVNDDRVLKLGPADEFFDRVLELENIDDDTFELPEGMTQYVSTSVAAVFRMLDVLELKKDDVLCDVGAGLFRIPLLVHLVTELPTMGIELNPTLCKRAEEVLKKNRITGVEILTGDATSADLSRASVFSFNLPFDGPILGQFLNNIYPITEERQITIYPFCWHIPFWEVEWLMPKRISGHEEYYFVSRPDYKPPAVMF